MIKLENMLTLKTIDLAIEVDSKDAAIHHLTNLLFKDGRLNSKELFLKDIFERETTMSTSMGEGIAIPHGKSNEVKETSIAIGRLLKPVHWNDEDEVEIVFLLAVKRNQESVTHLEVIAELATLLIDDNFKKILFEVQDANDLIKAIIKFSGENL